MTTTSEEVDSGPAPTTPPSTIPTEPITGLKPVLDVIPDHCLQRSTWRGLGLFGRDVVILGLVTWGLFSTNNPLLLVPVGGGGLIAGVAAALRGPGSSIRVVGVEPEGAPGMTRALEAGKPVRLESLDTIADGLAPPFVGELNLEHVRSQVEQVVLVSDDEIRAALRLLLERCKLGAEPSGAAAVAALLTGKIQVPADSDVVAVISGGNLDLAGFSRML